MKNTLSYTPPGSSTEYRARVDFDTEDRLFYGKVIGLRDVITFEGTTVDELEEDFRGAVDDYLELCQRRREEPDRPYSGKLNLRMSPELHRKLALEAEARGRSLNDLIVGRLQVKRVDVGSSKHSPTTVKKVRGKAGAKGVDDAHERHRDKAAPQSDGPGPHSQMNPTE